MKVRLAPGALALASIFAALTTSHVPFAGEPPSVYNVSSSGGAQPPLAAGARSPGPGPITVRSATATGSMTTVRWLHAAVPIAEGRVLVAGGNPTGETAISAEVYDPQTGTWKRVADMPTSHNWPVFAPMCDGRAFVAGRNGSGKEAEIYDPASDTWTSLGDMKYRHIYGQATLLPPPDCRILLSGGYDANTRGEVFDPATGVFKSVPGVMSSERFFHSATVLLDGRVLVAGGGVDINGVWYTYKTADIFDPSTNSWLKVKSMVGTRRAHSATLLLDGRVLVAGGTRGGQNGGTSGGDQLATSEIYDPLANTWGLLAAPLVTARALHTAAITEGGSVVLFGGLDASGSATRAVETLHDGVWQALPPLTVDRLNHAAVQLADGSVFLTGGIHQATTEIYTFGALGEACEDGSACGSGFCVDGVCCNEPCIGGCRRCDVSGHEGTCALPCGDEENALTCSDGTTTCGDEACVLVPCAPYKCDGDQGMCRAGCASVDDCAAGYACDLDGQCVPPPDVSAGEDALCSVGAPGKEGENPLQTRAFEIFALAGIAGVLSRRRRRTTR